ncbi:MAG TPA: 6,7-dimethyl-8-ribityllumazine synthase [Pelagibacteraceae bacterium]|jgi:6,7-dimethyl-8-ribityllumazine synthase|nr:6,7-dimethyl-8-ribityllumazine synthase [Pelagibacteraceae bacterium]
MKISSNPKENLKKLKNRKVCIVVSNFYPKISNMLIKGALKKLKKYNMSKFILYSVPGTFEIPSAISMLIYNKKNIFVFDGFIVLGCVIKGETSHFDYICSSVINAITNISVKYRIPIGNGILTCNKKKQAMQRADPKKGDRGGNAANAVISFFNLFQDNYEE